MNDDIRDTPRAIRKGDIVTLKPQWQDPGDGEITFVAIDDAAKGRVTIEAQLGQPINPTQVIEVDWIECVQ